MSSTNNQNNDDNEQYNQQQEKHEVSSSNAGGINDFIDDEAEVPLMSEDETTQEFLEYARYNDEGAAEKLKELGTKNPQLLRALDLNSGRSALHMAVANNFLHLVNVLVALPGIDVNIKSKSTLMTPLHDAVINNRVEISALLLSKGANPVAKAEDGETPIELAEKLAREEISALLLRADKTIDSYETEHGKITMDIDESEIDSRNQQSSDEKNNGGGSQAAAKSSSEEEKKNLDVDDVE